MKKVVVLLGILFGFSFVAHAESMPSSPQSAAGITQSNDAATTTNTDASPVNANTIEKIGTGSGDDLDTVNEADPSNDKDPEAGDDLDTDVKSTPVSQP